MATPQVSINDVSLRDGIQSESVYISHDKRLEIVSLLIRAGLTQIQIASFVHPQRVPQMRDIEELIERLPNKEQVLYSALVLNEKGLDRLRHTDLRQVDLSLSCSDTHSRRNTGLSLGDARGQVLRMIELAKSSRLRVRTGLQCVFDCRFEGATPPTRVLELCRDLAEAGSDEISLADSTGRALPEEVYTLSRAVQNAHSLPLTLHLHDTYGMGMANLVAAYEAGVRSFDASLGGVGGCPFIPGASGNVGIEDLVYLFDRRTIVTGIDIAYLCQAGEVLEKALGQALPGTMYQLLQRQGRASAHSSAGSSQSGVQLGL